MEGFHRRGLQWWPYCSSLFLPGDARIQITARNRNTRHTRDKCSSQDPSRRPGSPARRARRGSPGRRAVRRFVASSPKCGDKGSHNRPTTGTMGASSLRCRKAGRWAVRRRVANSLRCRNKGSRPVPGPMAASLSHDRKMFACLVPAMPPRRETFRVPVNLLRHSRGRLSISLVPPSPAEAPTPGRQWYCNPGNQAGTLRT